MNDEQLTQRMRAASEAVQMSDSAQAQHLEAISAALESAATPDADVISLAAAGTTRRRRIVASVVAAVVMAPAGLAAASEGSLPGDALYPVKQISERVLVLFDSEVVARHRIEEIEALEATGRFDPELFDDAREALGALEEGHPLWERLEAASATADDTDEDSGPRDDDDRSEPSSLDLVDVQLELPDGTQASFTLSGGELVDVSPPAGWTVVALDGDEATLRSVEIEVDVEVRDDASLEIEITDRRAEDDSSDDSAADDDNDGDQRPAPSAEGDPDDDGSESEGDTEPGDDDPSTDD